MRNFGVTLRNTLLRQQQLSCGWIAALIWQGGFGEQVVMMAVHFTQKNYFCKYNPNYCFLIEGKPVDGYFHE